VSDHSKPIPIKDILADADHPLNAEVKDMLGKLESGEISMCACMGPVYGEPHCPCVMRRHGLPSSPEHIAAIEESNRKLDELFGPGGEYYQPDAQPPADQGSAKKEGEAG
jgi:hypothetical protein